MEHQTEGNARDSTPSLSSATWTWFAADGDNVSTGTPPDTLSMATWTWFYVDDKTVHLGAAPMKILSVPFAKAIEAPRVPKQTTTIANAGSIANASKSATTSTTTSSSSPSTPNVTIKTTSLMRLPLELRTMVWEASIPTIRRNFDNQKHEVQAAMPGSTVLQICRESRAAALHLSRRNVLDFMPLLNIQESASGLRGKWRVTITLDSVDKIVDTFFDKAFVGIWLLGRPSRCHLLFSPHTLLSFYFQVKNSKIVWSLNSGLEKNPPETFFQGTCKPPFFIQP